MGNTLITSTVQTTSHFDFISPNDRVTLRYGYWGTGYREARGTVLLLNGRSEFMEKHMETVQALRCRGYDVYSLDWRGQGGSSRLLDNPQKGFVDSYEDYMADLVFFFREILHPRAPDPVYILAHSMGGHIALRFLHDYPGAAKKLVLSSPMLDIHTNPLPVCVTRALVRMAIKLGFAHRYCFGAGDYNTKDMQFENNLLTCDVARFLDDHKKIKLSPFPAVGGVTWRWLAATFDSIDILNEVGFAERIQIPVLMVCSKDDQIVSVAAQKRFANRLPDCKLLLVPNARHELLREVDDVRAFFWQTFDGFLGPLLKT